MANELFTVDEFNELIKLNKNIRNAYNDVIEFNEWLSYQGKGLKQMINCNKIRSKKRVKVNNIKNK